MNTTAMVPESSVMMVSICEECDKIHLPSFLRNL